MNKLPGEKGAKSAAVFAGDLAAQAQKHEKSAIWRTNSTPPLRELRALTDRLRAVSCILHEIAYDDSQPSILGIVTAARKSSLDKAIHAAARRCRTDADQRFNKRLQNLEIALRNRGCNAQCYSRTIDEPDSIYWPAKEVAVLIEITDFEVEAGYLEDGLSITQQELGNDWRFRIVPVKNSLVLAPLALLSSSHMPLPDLEFTNEWQIFIDQPFYSSDIIEIFDKALTACVQLSGILTCRDLGRLHPDESCSFF